MASLNRYTGHAADQPQRLNHCNTNYTYSDSNGDKVTKYFCTKCERDTANPTSNVSVCKKCKYALTRNGTCESYTSDIGYEENYQNVGGISMCEGAYFDNQTNTSHCFMCKEGHALERTDQGYKCVDSKIGKCIVSDLIDRRERCFVCRNAVPNLAFSKCEEKFIENLDKNCEFGMRHPVYNNGTPFCALCSRNYALIPVIQDNGQEKLSCKPTLKEKPGSKDSCSRGCARCDALGKCLWCSHYHGYYMIDEGTCAKFSLTLVANLLLTSILLLSIAF